MKQNFIPSRRLWAALLVLTAFHFTPCAITTQAQDRIPERKDDEKKNDEKKYDGKVEAVTAESLRVDGKTYTVTSSTKVSRDGLPAKINDLLVGDTVTGLYRKGARDGMEAVTVVATSRKN